MRIGIVVPSIYMYGDKFKDRISAPMELSVVLANGLTKKGNDVLFFSGPDVPVNATVVTADEDLLKSNYSMDYAQDLPPNALEAVSLYEKKKYFELSIVKKAFQLAKENKVDLLHVYHLVGGISHYFTELLEIPTLYTVHTNPPPRGTLEEWRYERFHNQNFVMVSDSHKKNFQKIIPEMNFFATVHHGIDIEEYLYNDQNKGYFASIGRLVPEKGMDVAIQAAKQLSLQLRIATQIDPVIDKSVYYQEKILPQVDGDQIRMVGFLRGEEKITFLQNAKALLFPISWEEPFGMVMIEAMSCGTPVIAYNRGSVSEIIKDGVTGFIIDPDDEDRPGKGSWIIKQKGIDGLVEAVRKIGEIDRKACRKHVEENFTVGKMVSSYEEVYREVINQ